MELTEWDVEQIKRLISGNKNAGYLVKTKTGKVGRTFHHEDLVNGKVIVHTEDAKLLCTPDTLTQTGFID